MTATVTGMPQMDAFGAWNLTVSDLQAADTGTLNRWSLTLPVT